MKKQKTLYFEIIRIIALFFVIYNHTGYDAYYYPSAEIGAVEFVVSLVLSVLCKISVPLFFMVSGALLLGREESFVTVLRRRVLRIGLVVVIISLFYYLVTVIYYAQPFNFWEYIAQVYSGYVVNSLWFLYAYMGFLLMLPFLRKIAAGLKKNEFLYLVVLKLVLHGGISVVELFTGAAAESHIGALYMVADSIFYPLAGYYLDNCMDEQRLTVRNVRIALVAGIAGLAVGCLTVYGSFLKEGVFSERYHMAFIMLPVFAVFLLQRLLFRKKRLASAAPG